MKLSAKSLLIGLFISTPSFSQVTPDVGLYGYNLGRTLDIPECSTYYLGKEIRYNPSPSSLPCFKRGLANSKSKEPMTLDEPLRVEFPKGVSISLASNGGLSVRVDEGSIIQEVSFETAGVRTQQMVIDELREKFGEPIDVEKGQVKTAIGASFDSMSATWKLNGAELNFQGAIGRIDYGLVTLRTTVAQESAATRLQRLYMKYGISRPKL